MDAAALRLADLESRRLCRFCLRTCPSEGGLTNIGGDSKLVSRIEFALTLEVGSQDGLPQRICDGCEWLLEKFYLFKDQCVNAERMLRTFAESGVPLMQYFKPVDFEEFRWRRKAWEGVDVAVQAVEAVIPVIPEPVPMYEMIGSESIKQELQEEEWSYAEEPAVELNVDYADRVTMDEIAQQIYGTEDAQHPQVAVQNVAELVTDMEIGSPHLDGQNIDVYDDISNDTVEYVPLGRSSEAIEEPAEPIKPVEAYPSFPEELLLMEDGGEQSQEPQEPPAEDSPLSPSDVIYEDLQTTPLRESDGLPTRFVDMEPGEIVSDDEYDTSSVVLLSSDAEDTSPPEKPVPIELSPLARPPSTPADDYRCGKCDRVFPQAQLLEAHQRAYHSKKRPSMTTSSAQQHKMAIMIDNPTKRCPKCATMVHKASYWAHIKSHSSGGGGGNSGGERSVVTSGGKDKEAVPAVAAAVEKSCELDDEFLWDKV